MPNKVMKCPATGKDFLITPREEDLYRKMDVPLPVSHPLERLRRKMAFRNERILYKRKCDFSGKNIISAFSEKAEVPVYEYRIWENDDWNPPVMDYDPKRDFLEQFKELFWKTPQPNLMLMLVENCDYANWFDRGKNCYLVSASTNCEDCYYSNLLIDCQDCFDGRNLLNCQLCLECVDGESLYNCNYVISSRNLTDSSFCFNCFSCQNCFGCSNLRNKQYHLFNQPYAKEEYEKKVKELAVSSYANVQDLFKKFEEIKKSAWVKNMDLQNCENCTGHHLKNCRNSFNCFNSNELEDCINTIYGSKIKDCADVYAIVEGSELCSEVFSCYKSYNCHFSLATWFNENVFYSSFCRNSAHLFGCSGLKKKSYCILNKQYAEKEYFALKEQIVRELTNKGIYGNFFPIELSPFPYEDTIAEEYFKGEHAHMRHATCEHNGQRHAEIKNLIPDDIDECGEGICKKVLTCEESGKPYKIIPQELSFYKQQGFPLPRVCFDVRHERRLKLTEPWELKTRKCFKCGMNIVTPYEEARVEKVLCEECWRELI